MADQTPPLSRPNVGDVLLLGARLGKVQPHAEGGWPEFTISVRYIVRTDDLDEADDIARQFFQRADFREDHVAP